MKNLIWTDSHICRENISELTTIFSEIMSYKADRVICLGDYYEKKTLSPEELIFGTSIMKKFVDKYPEVIMLEGNHDKPTIKYLIDLGVKVVPSEIIDNDFYGHFFVEESVKAFNSAKFTLNHFQDYRYVFLGHQHSFQAIGNGRFHPGSIIYVNFGEVEDISKYIFMLEDDEINFIELKSPIPMRDIFNLSDLDKIEKKTKVRYVIKNFNKLKEESFLLDKYKEYFYQFKIKLDFEDKQEEIQISPMKSIREIIDNWLNNIEDEEVKDELISSFKEEK